MPFLFNRPQMRASTKKKCVFLMFEKEARVAKSVFSGWLVSVCFPFYVSPPASV
uniref:Uncharacterized protein n=1 Tax=Uncultured archaeon GZfos26G2 TaxID=3386331 RepID=Q648H4_UNCAG|nr:hypothetical protein GZ37D1_50 [uncultured archaeon GZfos37D1]